ncbi:hypothetical protein K6U37_11505 [Vibrio parahaemolyticus]|uniref:hypothetical protein n=1 Tax=Vibrio parahaemolyticus TaxID=670 RepID=UPI001EEA7A08|nr:hypothetical protein [Vibrio parahaemolyticus]MCG6489585.1 hypothetical protein [Vibrio parahaemolyticus]
MDRLKEANDAYNEKKRVGEVAERANKRAKSFSAAKELFQMAFCGDCIRRSDSHIDVILHDTNINIFLDLLRAPGLFIKCSERIYRHRACKNLFLHNELNSLGGVNFARIILN